LLYSQRQVSDCAEEAGVRQSEGRGASSVAVAPGRGQAVHSRPCQAEAGRWGRIQRQAWREWLQCRLPAMPPFRHHPRCVVG